MKKLIALVLTFAVVFSTAATVFAEEAAPILENPVLASGEKEEDASAPKPTAASNAIEMNWKDIKEMVEGTPELKGKFVDLEVAGIKLYIPDSFEFIDFSDDEEMVETWIASWYVDDFYLLVNGYAGAGMTLDEYKDFLKAEFGVESIEEDLVNGYRAISYNYPDNDEMGFVALGYENGDILEIVLDPVNQEEYLPYVATIIASIMAMGDKVD